MKNNIKAIETTYKGYRFRSRLEARWAVFFDEMHIEYQYEPEGYRLPDGSAYLPDFYLPAFELFVEVKPNEQIPRTGWQKLIQFAADAEMTTLLIVGSPGEHGMYLLDRTSMDSWNYYEGHDPDEDISEEIFESLKTWAHVSFGAVPRRVGWQLVYETEPPVSDCDFTLSIANAKQSRFEHGQKGAPKK